MTNRRQFLSGCSTLAIAAACGPTALSAASIFNRDAGSEQLAYDAFSKCVGSTFVVRRGAKPSVVLKLTRARQQPDSPFARADAPDADHEKFSLLFRGPQSVALTQNTYTFDHDEMGRFEIFIVPVGPKDETHGYYEAIFNRPAGRPHPA